MNLFGIWKTYTFLDLIAVSMPVIHKISYYFNELYVWQPLRMKISNVHLSEEQLSPSFHM